MNCQEIIDEIIAIESGKLRPFDFVFVSDQVVLTKDPNDSLFRMYVREYEGGELLDYGELPTFEYALLYYLEFKYQSPDFALFAGRMLELP